MPWIGSKIGRAICDGCYAASKDAHFTGRNDLKEIGAYLPKGNGSEVIYCPICIMTKDEAFGGQASLRMTFGIMTKDKADALFASHWHTPEEALERGYTTRMVQVAARPEPPEPPAGQRDQNHQSQQAPPGMIQAAARPGPRAGQRDQNDQSQQVPSGMIHVAVVDELKAEVDELKAEVNMLKTEVYELKEELKLVKEEFARHDELETLQNEVRALKEQVSGQPSQTSSVLAKVIRDSGRRGRRG